ncbi:MULTISPECIES: TSUP family transporter [Bacillus]|uniref:TSUP family transporter n=1 Tax=Bacillus TaxID=1386 RepID=UPI0002EA2925|nr:MULTISPECIES: TSUP family transporter [Bacillus]MBO1582145.1 TSUP family transporter [Bacillus sp. XF8]MBY0598117.1 TSUP family transporter [Bacillus bingmayongensis]
MDELSLQIIVLLVAFGFLASFIDSVVGGGGLISLPALMFVGLPPASAIATNKLASTMGSLTSTIYFIRSKKVDFRIVGKLIPLTIIGAIAGALVVKFIPPDILRPLVLVMLVFIAIYIIVKKDWGSVSTYKKMTKGKALMFYFVILIVGFYDGFFGPGTGSFLIFAFLLIGLDFIRAAASGKVLNFVSNIVSLITFLFLDIIHFEYGIIMGLSMILGAYLGSKFAVQKGVGYVRTLFLLVTILLIGKNIMEYAHII